MPYYCTVPRCTSMAGKAKNVSFHQFPRDEELARLWNDILKRGKPYTKYSKVCSLHFKPEDYTITSVGKNKGQWRTLRKDAVPSQNLPSETPLPYSRKQWDSWSQTTTPNVIDPTVQSVQVAQAIYMQTMLAMQAAGNDPSILHNGPPLPELPQTSNEEKSCTSYKCTECTKCFKDPDVFMLHKRSHTKDNGTEKENFNMNVTLRSNPILANLLKTNNENNYDPSMVTMENLLMTALAANMDYIRNFSMVKDDRDYENDRNDFNHRRNDLALSRNDLVQSDSRNDLDHISDFSHSRSTNHGRTELHSAMNDLSRLRSELNHTSDSNHPTSDSNHPISDSNHRRDLDPDRDGNVIGNLKFSKDLSISVIDRSFCDKVRKSHSGDFNAESGDFKSDSNHTKSDSNHTKSDSNHTKSDSNNFLRNKDASSFIMDTASKINGNLNGFNKETFFSTENNDTENNGIENNDNGINRPNCDSDLNESMDSSDLVIDENA